MNDFRSLIESDPLWLCSEEGASWISKEAPKRKASKGLEIEQVFPKGSRAGEISAIDRSAFVVKVSEEFELVAAIALFNEVLPGKIFYRGQENFYGSKPVPGSARKGGSSDIDQVLMKFFPDRHIPFSSKCGLSDQQTPRCDVCCSALEPARFMASSPLPGIAIEPLLQQYFTGTSFLDVVDNIYIALWMASRHYTPGYTETLPGGIDMPTTRVESTANDWVYLYAMSFDSYESDLVDQSVGPAGLSIFPTCYVVDLRKLLPRDFLRPHAQSGSLLKWIDGYEIFANVAIIEVSSSLIGRIFSSSTLFKKEVIFPDYKDDKGLRTFIHMMDNLHVASADSSGSFVHPSFYV